MESIEIKSLNDLSGFKRNGCYQCIHRRGVPGSTHSSCAKYKAFIEADDHGIRNGWVMFPIDFDPTWISSCDSFISKEKEIELTRKDLLIKVYGLVIYLSQKIKSLHDKKMYDMLIEVTKEITEIGLEDLSVKELNKILNDLRRI